MSKNKLTISKVTKREREKQQQQQQMAVEVSKLVDDQCHTAGFYPYWSAVVQNDSTHLNVTSTLLNLTFTILAYITDAITIYSNRTQTFYETNSTGISSLTL